jgi:hypothetical protein
MPVDGLMNIEHLPIAPDRCRVSRAPLQRQASMLNVGLTVLSVPGPRPR